MKHIELLGIAGSGKSTIATELCARNEDMYSLSESHQGTVSQVLIPGPLTGIGPRLPSEVISYMTRVSGLSGRSVNFYRMKYPDSLSKAGRYARKYTDDEDRVDYVAKKVLSLVEQYGTIDEYSEGKGTVVIDEGFSFSAASVLHPPQHTRRVGEEDLRDYISTLPVPDAIILVKVSPRVCLERIHQRDSGPPASWERLNRESQFELATEATRVAESIAETFESRGSRILEVETADTPVESAVSTVEHALADIA